MSIMKLLVKAGLMQYTEEEMAVMTPEQRARITGETPVEAPIELTLNIPAAELVGKVMEVATVIPENVELDVIFKDAAVPASPYTYEKFSKLVDALAALDDSAKKAAVAAMDAADDSWTVHDIQLDIQNKRGALQQYQKNVAATVAHIETETQASIATTQKNNDEIISNLRAQIAQLETQISDTIQANSQAIGELHTTLTANKAAGERETQRIGSAISRMTSIENTYFV